MRLLTWESYGADHDPNITDKGLKNLSECLQKLNALQFLQLEFKKFMIYKFSSF